MKKYTKENGKCIFRYFNLLFLCIFLGLFNKAEVYGAKTDTPIEITDSTASVVNLYNNKFVHGLEFVFTYEDKTAEFVLIASDGAIYDPKMPNNEFTAEETKEGMIVRIPQAKKGQWKIRYNTGSKIKVEILDYESALLINGFKAGNSGIFKEEPPVSSEGAVSSTGAVLSGGNGESAKTEDSDVISEDNMVNWKFGTEHKNQFWYRYRIYLSESGKFDGMERLISMGEAYSGRETLGSFLLDVDEGEYYLLLETEYNVRGKSLISRACSNPFTYKGSNKVMVPEDFKVEAYKFSNLADAGQNASHSTKNEGLIRVSWDSEKMPWISKVRLTVTKDDVCIYKQNLDSMSEEALIKTEGGGKFKVSLACIDRNRVSDNLTKEFLWDSADGFKITYMDGELRNEYTWRYSYENAKNQKVTEEIAGVSTETVLSDSGERILTLSGNPCEVKISYEDDAGITWKNSFLVYQDNESPLVELYGDYSDVSTDSSTIDIKGKTETGAVVTVNGTKVPLEEDGSFLYAMPLTFGENILVLEVRDIAGNISRTDGKIHMVSSSEYLSDYKNSGVFALLERYPEAAALVISVVVITLILLTVFFFIRKWSSISAKAREELLKYPEYSEGRTIQRIRRARHMKMIANLLLGFFLTDLFLCIFCYMTGYYVSRLSQFDKSANLLPEAFFSMYSIRITRDELFVIANRMAAAGIILLIVTLLTQWLSSSIRKRADSSLIIEEKKLKKKFGKEKDSKKTELAVRQEGTGKAELAVRQEDTGKSEIAVRQEDASKAEIAAGTEEDEGNAVKRKKGGKKKQ